MTRRLAPWIPSLLVAFGLSFGLASTLSGCGTPGVRPRPLRPGISFSGIWDSNWGEMKLTQAGKRVYGTFKYRNGTVTGNLEGDVLHFKWKQQERRYAGAGS